MAISEKKRRNDNGKRRNTFVYREVPDVYNKAFGTFDLETYGLGGEFADGVTCAPQIIWPEGEGELVMDQITTKRHRTLQSLFDELMNPYRGETASGNASTRGFTWLAHNGARYDFCYIIKMLHDEALRRGFEIHTVMQGPKLIGMSFKDCDCPPEKRRSCKCPGKITIMDSFPNLQTNLDRAAKTFAPSFQKLSGDIDFEGGEIYDPENAKHVAYMLRDAESLWWTWKGFTEKTIEAFGIYPGMTAGGTAIKAWKATIPEGHVYFRQSPTTEEFLENFKVGGFVWPGSTRLRQENMVTIDRTGAYAATGLMGRYPISKAVEVDRYYPDSEYLGFYEVEVTVPEDPKIVPMFSHKGMYPYGTFVTFASSEHLDWSAQFGVAWKFRRGYIFEKCENIFDDFLRKCEAAEYPSDGTVVDDATRAPYKNSRNSITGRFAMGRFGTNIVIGPMKVMDSMDDLDDAEMAVDPDTGNIMPYRVTTEERDAAYIHPEWYALMTERQRREMIDLLMLLDPDERGKVDTDSITLPMKALAKLVKGGRVKLEPGYGNYKIEHDWAWLEQLGPKNYRGLDRKTEKEEFACKGMPKKIVEKAPVIQRLASRDHSPLVEIESLYTPLAVLEKGLDIPKRSLKRKLSTPWTVKSWVLTPDGKFKAPVVKEED